MSELLNEIEDYWSNRAEGYSQVNQEELQGSQRDNWTRELVSWLPKPEKEKVRILDVGTGPGFFSILLTEQGYDVTAVDYTPEMLEKAKENAGELADQITFKRMDAQKLEFEDGMFDAVVSRNLTWNLENPKRAYAEWTRVLKPGGVLLNFDANWYHHLFDETKRKEYEEDRRRVQAKAIEDHYTCTDVDRMEDIARKVPLSAAMRPQWDEKVLGALGVSDVSSDASVWERVLSDVEKLNYASTPGFMVRAVK